MGIRDWSLRALAIGLSGLALLASCGSEQPTAALQQIGQAATASAPGDQEAPVPPVGLAWDPAVESTSPPKAASDLLYARVSNLLAIPQDVRVSVVASGLDGRLAETKLESFRLQAGAERRVSVRVGNLPIQSEVAPSWASLDVVIDRPDGAVHITSTPVYYHFQNAYKEAKFYGSHEAALSSASSGVSSAVALGAAVASDTMDVRGRILQDDGTWLAASGRDLAPGSRSGLTGAVAVPAGSTAGSAQAPAPQVGSAGAVAESTAVAASPQVRICSTWRAQFTDAGFGEDYMKVKGWADDTASYAHALVLTVPGNALRWQGQLSGSGCTPYLTLAAGTYRLQQNTDSIGTGSVFFDSYRLVGAARYMYSLWADFSWANSATADIFVHPAFNNEAVQAAAVASAILGMHLGSSGLSIPNGHYVIYANHGCGANASCYYTDGVVHISPDSNGGSPHSHWKYIVSHEIGHNVQAVGMGVCANDTGYVHKNELPASSLCGCEFYSDSVSNTTHCLQSREMSEAAQGEAFGHAFATRVFNRNVAADATLVYYKPFLPYAGAAVLNAPVSRDAYNGQRWMENHCLAAARGVEWDWTTFFYKVSSESLANKTSFGDLFNIYKIACTGNSQLKCNRQDVQWASLDNAARQLYGATDPRYTRFRTTGEDYGVDH